MKIPPILHVAAAAVIAWALNRFVPIWQFGGAFASSLAWVFGITGAGFLIVALSNFRSNDTTIDPRDPSKAQHLVVTGVYRITRNPMYVSMAFLLAGWCFYLGSIASFLVLPLFVIVINESQIKGEERALLQNFGAEYETYRKQVRRWL
ncbi:MAG: methyltransferase family protein [Paracoccaceae bacterium]|uniref:methyltransferase family protein n=1 Tax=Celeribacter marinus TaxID=1397108 RepID=UPI00318163A8